jgi:acyl-CoA reductase-like NAD-dependent aldehyde dehydrogenase
MPIGKSARHDRNSSVAVKTPTDDTDDLAARANDTDYGLAAFV